MSRSIPCHVAAAAVVCFGFGVLPACGTDTRQRSDEFGVDEPAGDARSENAEAPDTGGEPTSSTEQTEPEGVRFFTYGDSLETIGQWGDLDPEDDSTFGYRFEIGPRADEDDRLGELGEKLTKLEDGETAFFGLGGPFSGENRRLFECGPGGKGPLREALDRPDDDVHYTWRLGDYLVQCRWPKLVYAIERDPEAPARGRFQVKDVETVEREDQVRSRKDVTVIRVPPEPRIPPRFLHWYRTSAEASLARRLQDSDQPHPKYGRQTATVDYYLSPSADSTHLKNVRRWMEHLLWWGSSVSTNDFGGTTTTVDMVREINFPTSLPGDDTSE